MIDPIEIETMPKKPSYAFAYAVIALGIAVIVFHYTVFPHIWSQYGI